MAKIDKLILKKVQLFLKKLKEEGINFDSAYLFGSYAKNCEYKWSDIDVAVISSDLSEDRLKERIRLTKIAYDIDSRIEPVPFRPDAFIEEDPLVWEIKKEGILI